MKCPKCTAGLEKVTFEGIEVARCTACRGLWFDPLQHTALRELAGSEVIDDGLKEVGRAFDAQLPRACPSCAGTLIRMVDAEQPHLWYESCSSCFGVFFDAGEFRDYKHVGWLDKLKDLLRGERS